MPAFLYYPREPQPPGASLPESSRRIVAGQVPYAAATGIALFLVVPFLVPFSTLPVLSFYQEWLAFALGCAVFIASAWLQRSNGIEVPRTFFLPVGICILLLIQALLGRLGYWQQSATGVIYLGWSVVLLVTGAMLRRQLGWDSFCALAAGAICVGALLSALIGLLQLAQWELGGLVAPMTEPRMRANLGQSNHFANYVCLGLFSICFLASDRRLNGFVAGGAVLLLLLVADLSGSRSVWAYLLAGASLAFWTHFRVRSRQTRALAYWVAGACAAMVAVSMVSTGLLHEFSPFDDALPLHQSATERLLADQGAVSHRHSIWRAAWQMFENAPVTGVGYGGFAWEYFVSLGRLPAGLPEEIVDHAHNTVLQMLAEFGLPGALLLVAAAVAFGLSVCREPASPQRWWLITLIVVISVHSLVEYPLWYANFLGLFALLVGAGDRVAWQIKPAVVSSTAILAVAVAMAWLLGSVFLDYRLVERLGAQSAASRDNHDVIVAAARASQRSLFGNFIELGLSRTITIDRNALDAKVELNRRVLRVFPAPDVAYRQSALYAMQGDTAAAYSIWDLAVNAYPGRASAAANALAARVASGEVMLEPLVEYAASRSKEQQ